MSNGYEVLHLPFFVKILYIVAAVLGVVIIGLVGFATNVYGGWDVSGLSIFTAIATWIVVAYALLSERLVPSIYNFWAILGCDIFLAVFWLVSMAVAANWASSWSAAYNYADDIIYTYYAKRSVAAEPVHTLVKRFSYSDYRSAYRCVAASAGLAGLELVLFAVILIFTGLAIHRVIGKPRGIESTPAATETGMAGSAGMPERKMETAETAPQQQQQQQTYQQQETYPQQETHPQQSYPQQSYQQPQEVPAHGESYPAV